MGTSITVLNPNSSQSVTDGLSEALESLRFAGGPGDGLLGMCYV